MIDLDRRWGPWTGRVWGLVLNFIGNGVAVYGAIGVMRNGTRLPLLIIGAGLTVGCILLLARPSNPREE